MNVVPAGAQHPQLPAAVVNPQAVPNIQVAAAAMPAAAVLAPAHVAPLRPQRHRQLPATLADYAVVGKQYI